MTAFDSAPTRYSAGSEASAPGLAAEPCDGTSTATRTIARSAASKESSPAGSNGHAARWPSKRDSGWDAAYAAEEVANDKLYAAIDALCQAPITIRVLVEKARFVEIDEDVFGHRMVPSILDDLLAMGDVT